MSAPGPFPLVKTGFAQAAQILAAALGGLIFDALGIPAAWLSGAVAGAVLWGATGLGRTLPPALGDAVMLVLGLVMGAGVTPEALAAIGRYPVSLALLLAAVVAITLSSQLWLVRVSRWRADDALLASVPGALSTVLAVAADRKADVPAIAVVQSFRLLVLIAVLPSLVVSIGGGPAAAVPAGETPLLGAGSFALMLAAGLTFGLGFQRIGMAAPMLLGATAASALAHGTGWEQGSVPPIIGTGALVLLGVYIADRFRTLDGPTLRRILPTAAGSFVVGVSVAAVFALAAVALAPAPLAEALVAFAPGGLEAMVVLAFVLGLDPLYVGTHHLVRFLGIGFVLPAVVGLLARMRGPGGETGSA